jgi:hypothetical protein
MVARGCKINSAIQKSNTYFEGTFFGTVQRDSWGKSFFLEKKRLPKLPKPNKKSRFRVSLGPGGNNWEKRLEKWLGR